MKRRDKLKMTFITHVSDIFEAISILDGFKNNTFVDKFLHSFG